MPADHPSITGNAQAQPGASRLLACGGYAGIWLIKSTYIAWRASPGEDKAGRAAYDRRMPRTKRAPHPADARTIKDLLSYRVHRLANALSRGAALRYRQDFDVSLMEWRTLALLGDFAPMALKDIARQSGLDKGLASRVVSGLVGRGLIHRAPGQEDARELALRLTPSGQAVYAGLMAAATQRDDAFRAALTEEELRALDTILAKLLQAALIQVEAPAD